MNITPLVYHQDPGHGWIEIDRSQAKTLLGDQFKRISPYSYQKGQRLFLEEDCDAGLLINAAKQQGIELQLTDLHYTNEAIIRNYKSFKP